MLPTIRCAIFKSTTRVVFFLMNVFTIIGPGNARKICGLFVTFMWRLFRIGGKSVCGNKARKSLSLFIIKPEASDSAGHVMRGSSSAWLGHLASLLGRSRREKPDADQATVGNRSRWFTVQIGPIVGEIFR